MNKVTSHCIQRILLSLCAVFGYLFAQATFAHTTIVPSSLHEGDRVFADISISHGCDGKAVRAMGLVFPSSDSMMEIVDGDQRTPVKVADHLDTGTRAAARLAQDKDVFRKMDITDQGATRAFHYKRGYLQPNLSGQIPFRYSAPRFLPESCAKKVDILIPIVNWCSKSKHAPDRADVWMGRLTGKFNDPAIQPVGFWPRITVHRNSETNPLPKDCGEGVDTEWSPTDEEIDHLLPLKRYWPANVHK